MITIINIVAAYACSPKNIFMACVFVDVLMAGQSCLWVSGVSFHLNNHICSG